MTLDEFWQTVEGLNPENAIEELTERLQALSPAEIIEFDAHFWQMQRRAYDWLLWAAAYVIDGGCSDDGFTDFRYGLISRGRAFYESALRDPDSLADLLPDNDFIPKQGFGYVASRVYKAKTGEDMPDAELPPRGKPSGENWDFDDPELCAQKLPELWRRYGDS